MSSGRLQEAKNNENYNAVTSIGQSRIPLWEVVVYDRFQLKGFGCVSISTKVEPGYKRPPSGRETVVVLTGWSDLMFSRRMLN